MRRVLRGCVVTVWNTCAECGTIWGATWSVMGDADACPNCGCSKISEKKPGPDDKRWLSDVVKERRLERAVTNAYRRDLDRVNLELDAANTALADASVAVSALVALRTASRILFDALSEDTPELPNIETFDHWTRLVEEPIALPDPARVVFDLLVGRGGVDEDTADAVMTIVEALTGAVDRRR